MKFVMTSLCIAAVHILILLVCRIQKWLTERAELKLYADYEIPDIIRVDWWFMGNLAHNSSALDNLVWTVHHGQLSRTIRHK